MKRSLDTLSDGGGHNQNDGHTHDADLSQILSRDAADPRVPATVLTGFLGSGKTTLLNHILTATHGKKIAIIENEFGDTAIDDALVAKNGKFHTDEEIIEVLNGCICCTVRQDLIKTLTKLGDRVRCGSLKLDGIIIETTGMADPAPVAQTFLVDEKIRAFAQIDGSSVTWLEQPRQAPCGWQMPSRSAHARRRLEIAFAQSSLWWMRSMSSNTSMRRRRRAW